MKKNPNQRVAFVVRMSRGLRGKCVTLVIMTVPVTNEKNHLHNRKTSQKDGPSKEGPSKPYTLW